MGEAPESLCGSITCGVDNQLSGIAHLDFFSITFAGLLEPTGGLCSLASSSAVLCAAAEDAAKHAAVAIATRAHVPIHGPKCVSPASHSLSCSGPNVTRTRWHRTTKRKHGMTGMSWNRERLLLQPRAKRQQLHSTQPQWDQQRDRQCLSERPSHKL